MLFVLLYTQLYTILASQGAAGLSPPWTAIDEKNVRSAVFAARRESHTTSIISTTPPATANSDYTEFGIYTGSSSIESTYTPPSTAGADDSPTATNSQLSNEIEKCLATYIRCNSPRQLNLSDLNYALLVQALKQSNHPDVFRLAVKQVEHDLRVSHREFINFVLRAPALPSHSSHSFASRLIGAALIALSLATAVIMTVSNIRREFRAVVVPFFFAGVVTSFCAERQVFVWCSEEVEELLEGGGVEGKGKRKVQGVVVMQGVWAGGLAAVCFCALFLLVPQGNKF